MNFPKISPKVGLVGCMTFAALGMANCRAREAEAGQSAFGLDRMDAGTRRDFLIFAGVLVLSAATLIALRTKAK